MKANSTYLIGVSLWLLGANAISADLPKEGKYDHQGCYIGPHYVIAHSKDQMGGSYAANGASLAPAGDPFHGTSGVCYGSWTLINGEYNEMGSCEFTDGTGDKFMGVYTRKNQEPGNWRIVAGTGKFRGITGSGNFIPSTPMPQPAGQVVACNRELGTWKLP
jgi:hypothetical protein